MVLRHARAPQAVESRSVAHPVEQRRSLPEGLNSHSPPRNPAEAPPSLRITPMFITLPPLPNPAVQESVQDSPFDETELGETLVVAPRADATVTTSAAKVTVIDGDELRRTGERSLPRALGRAAGVWVQESNLGGGAPIVRGLYGNQILILVDGVRLNDSTTRFGPNQSLNTLDPAMVDRVEVIHGSSAVLYGSDAIGGVISIWTRRRMPAGENGDRAVHGVIGGRYDTASDGSRTWIETSTANETVGVFATASTEDWGDLRVGGGDTQAFTGYDNVSFFSSVDVALDEARNLRVTGLLHRDFDVPRTFSVIPGFGQDAPSFAQYDFQLQEREQILVALDDANGGGFGDAMQLRVFARQYDEARDKRRTGSNTQVYSRTRVDTLGFGVDWTRAVGEDHFLTYGVDLESDRVDSFQRRTDLGTNIRTHSDGDFAPDARYTSFGVFVQDELTQWEPLYVTLGVRFSAFDFAFDDNVGGRERGDFSNVNASIEVARDLSDSLRWSATLAQGFQAPNLEDLANDGDFAGGLEVANPDLDPAKSWMIETGLEVIKPRWSGYATVFYTRINDFIGRQLTSVGDPGTSGDETFLRVNAGRVELYGVETSAQTELFEEGSPWILEGTANWVRGRQFDGTIDPNTGRAPLDGVDARRIPPLNGRLSVAWNNPVGRAAGDSPRRVDRAGVTFVWAAEQDELNPDDISDPRINPDGTPGWTTWTIDLAGELAPGIEWSLSMANLFDENYRSHGSGLDAPGRSIIAGLSFVF